MRASAVSAQAQRSAAALKFFRWAFTKGQKQALALDYVPLPPALVSQINTYVTANIK